MKRYQNQFLRRLEDGPLLCAEGYVFELERRGYIQAGAYVPEVVLEFPNVVLELHREFLRAGSDIAVALTYYAHREKLRIIGRLNDLERMNRQALRLARQAADEYDSLVAGNICNTWAYQPKSENSAQEVRRQYEEQVAWAADEGVDFILAETLEYVGEALIALEVIKSFHLPAVINFSAIYAKSKDGYDWIDACSLLAKNGADVVGFNCARGPATLTPLVKNLRAHITSPISALPVAYRTDSKHAAFQFLKNRDGTSAYTLGLEGHLIDRQIAAQFATTAAELNVNIVGLCCGAGPHHIRAMAEAMGRTPPASRYSPDMTKHSLLGNGDVVRSHEKKYLKQWV